MPILRLLCISFLMTSAACVACAQQVVNPEALAGRWGASDGNGGQVGMNIIISTTVDRATTDLASAPQTRENIEFALFQRKDADVEPLGFSFFTPSSRGGAIWDGRELRIDLTHIADLPEVHVDLAWNDQAKVWTGIFERGAFRNRAITLRPPSARHNNLFVGTWFDGTNGMNNCLHVAQSEDGTFTAWGDDLQVPGRIRYANGIRPPERAIEHYGEVANVKVTSPDRIVIEMRAYTAICCSHPFNATLSPDGDSLVGEWPAGPNQAYRPVKWTRAQGDSFRSGASFR